MPQKTPLFLQLVIAHVAQLVFLQPTTAALWLEPISVSDIERTVNIDIKLEKNSCNQNIVACTRSLIQKY